MNQIKEHFLEKSTSKEILDIVELIDSAERAGLLIEVIYTALEEMKLHPQSSPLLCLQIALDDWDC
jgi:hypothetical protein